MPSVGVDARLGEQVAGELFADELIVGDVAVEGADEVIAILVRPLGRVVPLVAVGVGVADDVHPVASEALAEMGRGEQLIDQFLVSLLLVLSRFGQKAFAQLGRGGKPVRTKDSRRNSTSGSAGEAGFNFAASRPASINRSIGSCPHLPATVFGTSTGRSGFRAPPVQPLLEFRLPPGVGFWNGTRTLPRVEGAVLHPPGQNLHSCGCQCLLGGHLEIFVQVADGLDEQALIGLARNDRRPRVAARHPAGSTIQPKSAFVFLRPVTTNTPSEQQRPYLVLEEIAGRAGKSNRRQQ